MADEVQAPVGDPSVQFAELKTALEEQITKTFPIRDKAGRFEVRVSDVTTIDKLGVEDIKEQHKRRIEGKSWSAQVNGVVEVVDLQTGKTLVRRTQRITDIPKMTRHGSWIIDGQEMSLMNQWRLRPGAYVKATERAGEYEAQFQLAKGKSFDLQQEERGNLFMKIAGRKIPLYSVLQATGVTDDQMIAAWGAEAFHETKKKAKDKDLQSMYEAWKGSAADHGTDFKAAIPELLSTTQLDPEIAHQNLGVRSSTVNGAMLLAASRKLIDVAAKRTEPDPIDSLRYKELWTAKDHMVERLARSSNDITLKVQSAFRKSTVVDRVRAGDESALRDIVTPDLLRKPMFFPFTSTSLASVSKQTNPIAMIADRSATTIMGPGGIKNSYMLNSSNTAIDPSHLGFLDPVFTPESNPGVTTHLAFGVRPASDRRPMARLYNLRTKAYEDVDAATAATKIIVLPDQVTWKNDKPSPRIERFRSIDGKGELRDDVKWHRADYVMPSTSQVFALETNLVPFMQNDSAGRTTMSARHMAQAISIVGREAPLVCVEARPGKSFEELIGNTFLSHNAPEGGKVTRVTKGDVTIQDRQGKSHTVQLYDHYPTNDQKGMLHSTPLVHVGQTVKRGQTLADNNFTRDGVLALGTNLRVAYLSNGFNHEDGIVISETAAKKLASQHLHKPAIYAADTTIIDKKAFLDRKAGVFTPDRLNKIDDTGTVKVGTRVKPGDPLILALNAVKTPTGITADSQQRLGQKLRNPYTNASVVWDSNYEGEVVSVHRVGRTTTVHVRTLEPAQVGSKLSTRHSAKGIVAQILPDHEMPVNEKGKPMDMLLAPVGVPGRNNPGQILETAAGRIAEKTGKPYVVKNFQGGVNYLKKIEGELKQHGLKDTDTLYDPKSGRRLGEVMAGPHYVYQLEHQIDKKTHVRSGGPVLTQSEAPKLHYDADTKIPRGGGHTGAQSLGSLGISAALASGLHDNLREMQTLKSDEPQAREVWGELMNGKLLPPPQVPFAYKRFEAMLQGMGVNLEKTATSVRIIPRSDAETRALSRGALKDPTRGLRAKDDRPEPGGLFDPTITGGAGAGGKHWSHIELAEAMPHPIYAKPIAHALGIREEDIPEILAGKKELNGLTGPKAFQKQLKALNVDAELKKARDQLADPKVRGSQLNKANEQFKALRVLKELDRHPKDAWMIKAVPVIPPVYRPAATMPDGTFRTSPLNQLYRRLGSVNASLERSDKAGVPWNSTLDTRAGLYQELNNLFGTTPKGKKALDLDMRGTKEDRSKKLPGIIHMIAGEHPKDGFFQDKLISKKQDYTARATIVGDPTLSVDELGVPRKLAVELMRPMVVARLIRMGKNSREAHLLVSRRDPLAYAALAEEVKHRPVLMKRDPVLHQYGLVGQNIKLIDSEAIKVSPLVLPPIGGDIDGDTVSLYVPLHPKAIEEVKRVVPSQRTISESSGDVLYSPANEAALSLYRTTLNRKKSTAVFASKEEAEKAFTSNKIDLDSVMHVKGIGDTTLGRLRIAHVVPEAYKKDILTNLNKPFDRGYQGKLLKDVAKNQPKHFVELADNLSRLGFQMAYESGHTVSLKDLQPLTTERNAIVRSAQKKVDALNRGGKGEQTTEVWLDATKKIHEAYGQHYSKNPTNISDMAVSGIKAKREQFQGLVMAPMLVEDHRGQPGRVPITTSFSEGIDVGGYFVQASGARRGVIQKVDAVREPGYMSKLLVRATIDQPITANDCGTAQGIGLSVRDRDVIDRHLAIPTKIGKATFSPGTIVTPEMQTLATKEGIGKLVVRSPLKCRMPQGVCSKCMGIHPSGAHWQIGENAGLVSAQALGERAAQLMLKQTHGGGIVSLSKHTVQDFEDVQRLFNAAKRGREDAAVAPKDGLVTRVEKLPQGTYAVHLAGRKVPLYSRQAPLPSVKAGYAAKRGEVLTNGEPNLHDVLATQGHEAAQAHMTRRIGDIYAREGVLRRHTELAVRNAMGMVLVTDPGGHGNVLRDDHMMRTVVDEMNRNSGKAPIKYDHVLVPLKSNALARQPDWMARLGSENLAKSMLQAAQHGETSHMDGLHPLPGLAQGAHYNLHPKKVR
jgi:DNA-directed RNA polymerase subunit beta'